jgi:dihydropteroate synthase
VTRGEAGRATKVRYVLPRHKAANWVGLSRSQKSTRPGANGVVELSPFEFLDRLADLVPPPRKHRHRYHGVFAPNHATQKPRSHDTSRIAWAKLMARVGEDFPMQCPGCGGDIRLIAFITEPGPIRKILTHLGEPLEPPPVSPARGPPTEWAELVQAHDEREAIQTLPDELPVIDIHSL